jgi:peptidase M20/M25/M40-like protein
MFRVGGEPPVLSEFLAAERDSVLDALAGWVRIPSIGAQSAHDRDVEISAEWCAERMSAAGLEHVDSVKTIVPAAARLKVTFRLVADQSPEAVADIFEAWAREQIPAGIELDIHRDIVQGPALTPTDHPAVAALARSIGRVWGAEPRYTRSGGSGPEEVLGRVLAAPVLHLGISLTSDRIHAPNEGVDLGQLDRGVLAAAELWRELAELS